MALRPSRGWVTAVYRNHRRAIEVNRPYLRFSRLSPLRLQPSHHLLGIFQTAKLEQLSTRGATRIAAAITISSDPDSEFAAMDPRPRTPQQENFEAFHGAVATSFTHSSFSIWQ